MSCPLFARLSNGDQMPLMGYGTWQAAEGELEAGLQAALQCGYRHIDTAAFYVNEATVGDIIQNDWIGTNKLTRSDLFLVTKLPPSQMRPDGVHVCLDRSLSALQVDCVDVFLLHVPFGFEDGDDLVPVDEEGNVLLDHMTDHLTIWKAMEEEVDAGRARAIGLSNFNQRQIQRILDNCRIKPANLQIELHVYMQQRPLVEFCQKHGIVVTAYSPLGSRGSQHLYTAAGMPPPHRDLLTDPVVGDIAARLNKTHAQVLLRHIIQRGIVVIPKSTNEQRIAQNMQVFDFELTPKDVADLDALDKGDAGRFIDMKFLKGVEKHPEYPF